MQKLCLISVDFIMLSSGKVARFQRSVMYISLHKRKHFSQQQKTELNPAHG